MAARPTPVYSYGTDGTITLPLTSIFTPPASCASHWTYEDIYYNSVSGGLLMQNVHSQSIDEDCFPSGFRGNGRVYTSQVYSPGACPEGYTTPALFQNGETTTAVCCLTGFSYSTTYSTVKAGPSNSVLFAGCLSMYDASSSTTVPGRAANTELNATVITGPVTMWGQPITVQFQQRDLSLFPDRSSSTSASSTRSIASQTVSPVPGVVIMDTSATATATAVQVGTGRPELGDGMSAGAKAGVGVGVALAILLLVALAGFLLWRKRRAKKAQMAGGYAPSHGMLEKDGTQLPVEAPGDEGKRPPHRTGPPVEMAA